ncbi:MAG: PAS domain S-box protein, partial [Candidatus Hydrogenedentes bacterium]|nr:PAS domain S-box protein [Candidatus Hydrogenedentota bacterium]
MSSKQSRSGIERKFLTSILWVGVIPMALALVSGYVLARENQKNAVRINLETAVRVKADGLNLTLEGRLQRTRRSACAPDLLQALSGASFSVEKIQAVLRRMKAAAIVSGDKSADFVLYDTEGGLRASTRRGASIAVLPSISPEASVHTRVAGFDKNRYVALVMTPILLVEGGEPIAYLGEYQSVSDLLRFVLEHEQGVGDSLVESYEIAYQDELGAYRVFYARHGGNGNVTSAQTIKADPGLVRHLKRQPPRDSDTLTLSNYLSHDGTMSAVVAYHRLFPDTELFLLAYRPTSDIYENINLAAILTLVLSGAIIGLFCIIAYRNVHNNIIRPVSLLNEGAQIVRQGDLELKLVIGTGDEIEELAMSFNKMASALRANINQLEESEERYRNLITSMRDGICQANTEGVITLINPAGVEILGYSEGASVVGLCLRDIFLERMDYARVTQELERCRFVERVRVWMKRHDERTICVELSMNRVFDESGAYIGMEGTFRDVTQNVVLEQEARERSERIAAINQIANTINSSLEAGRVYESVVVEVRSLIAFDYAEVVLLNGEDGSWETHHLWPEPVVVYRPGERVEKGPESAFWVAREKKVLCVDDLRGNASPFAGEFPSDITSCLCLPLYATERIIGTLNLGSRDVSAFGKHEIEILG